MGAYSNSGIVPFHIFLNCILELVGPATNLKIMPSGMASKSQRTGLLYQLKCSYGDPDRGHDKF